MEASSIDEAMPDIPTHWGKSPKAAMEASSIDEAME